MMAWSCRRHCLSARPCGKRGVLVAVQSGWLVGWLGFALISFFLLDITIRDAGLASTPTMVIPNVSDCRGAAPLFLFLPPFSSHRLSTLFQGERKPRISLSLSLSLPQSVSPCTLSFLHNCFVFSSVFSPHVPMLCFNHIGIFALSLSLCQSVTHRYTHTDTHSPSLPRSHFSPISLSENKGPRVHSGSFTCWLFHSPVWLILHISRI